MKNRNLPEGYHSDDESLWAGAEDKNKASIRLDFTDGSIYCNNVTFNCPNCGTIEDNEDEPA